MSLVGPANGILLRGRLNRLLLDAWFAARDGDVLPSRERLRPSALKMAMPLLMILDYRSAEEVVCLMTGTRIREFLGFELTGINIHNLSRQEIREPRRRRFRLCAEQPCGMSAVLDVALRDQRSRQVEFLMLPLRAVDGLQFFCIASAVGEEIELPRGEHLAGRATPFSDLAVEYHFVNLGAGIPAEMP